jgi:hypothetical protein
MPHIDDDVNYNINNDVDSNEYDENDNTPISKEELITLTLNERQDATYHMFNLLDRIIKDDAIDFMRFMNYSNFNRWFIDHFESDIVD